MRILIPLSSKIQMGSHKIADFVGSGDMIEAFLMEQIKRFVFLQ